MTRLINFKNTHLFIAEHNRTNASWKAGHNQFSDWSHEEYKAILGYINSAKDMANYPTITYQATDDEDEDDDGYIVNWVEKGAVTPVKNQGDCGSCWSFSTTGSLEGAHFVATDELLSFSEQQLIDCSDLTYGNYGCNGGRQVNAYVYF